MVGNAGPLRARPPAAGSPAPGRSVSGAPDAGALRGRDPAGGRRAAAGCAPAAPGPGAVQAARAGMSRGARQTRRSTIRLCDEQVGYELIGLGHYSDCLAGRALIVHIAADPRDRPAHLLDPAG